VPTTHHHGHDVGERLYVRRRTPVHALPAEVETLAMVAFVFAVIATPNQQFWAFGAYALLLAGVAMARIPATTILPRMLVEVPFVLFAVLMPFLATPRSRSSAKPFRGWTAGGLEQLLVEEPWAWSPRSCLPPPPARDLLLGLERLRVPS
jgi:cobalt/nickel transport system permease protein